MDLCLFSNTSTEQNPSLRVQSECSLTHYGKDLCEWQSGICVVSLSAHCAYKSESTLNNITDRSSDECHSQGHPCTWIGSHYPIGECIVCRKWAHGVPGTGMYC